jgi:hypothetical protein
MLIAKILEAKLNANLFEGPVVPFYTIQMKSVKTIEIQ